MLIVQKFGGTSVENLERMKIVCRRIANTKMRGDEVVVVVSAMAGETDRLLRLGHEASRNPDLRELDVLISTGEQVSVALISIILKDMGIRSMSFLAPQIRILTNSKFSDARIEKIETEKLFKAIKSGIVPVVAGFQGVDSEGNITTLGRGGSDTTAVALAAALKADICEIYTDVEGVFTADPRIVPNAKKIPHLSYEEMLELASLGAKVLHLRCVELAMMYGIPIHVRSTFSENEGTIVS